MNNTNKSNMNTGGKIPISKWWSKGTSQQKMVYAVAIITLVTTIVSTIFIVVKSIARVESKNEVAGKYVQDRKQSNYVTDEEYEKRSKSSEAGLMDKKSDASKNDTNVLNNAMNRCAMYNKMITDTKDKHVTKSLCREANLEYCALPSKCNTSSNSANITNQLLLIALFLIVGVGFFMLLNKSKSKNKVKNNVPKPKNNTPVRITQPIYGQYSYPSNPYRNNMYYY